MLKQLHQNYLPLFCDEEVYRFTRHIVFEKSDEFNNIILCLGNFDIIKVLQTCIGKYLKNSGIENIFIETALIDISKNDNKIIDVFKKQQLVPSWSCFNSLVTVDNRARQQIGYLPIILAPVTKYATVYTALCNFKDLLQQLNQNYLPLFCDEGVYRIARHIVFEKSDEFNNIILCLGNFHIIKVLQTCIGKYLKNSGIENIFIETALFGINTVEQLMSGTNYARCVKGLTYLIESLRRLQLQEFFNEKGLEKYEQVRLTIYILNESFEIENIEECVHVAKQFRNHCSILKSDFIDFVKKRCNESDLFKDWNNVVIMISLMLDLIRADRTGNWSWHLKTIEKL
ncbi:hypothetical protein TSAR_009883 [Trichomalopsis sarcophagae]|uniref:Uncharacterized protein n=1 Tax=Trichomalopsis sarcophagae TaxID=543379 RepID=A0A232EJ24_9HYME|nr:hypothetical protein TSAR_009883 [Trichomalopsis sarcophagae]